MIGGVLSPRTRQRHLVREVALYRPPKASDGTTGYAAVTLCPSGSLEVLDEEPRRALSACGDWVRATAMDARRRVRSDWSGWANIGLPLGYQDKIAAPGFHRMTPVFQV